MRDRGVFGSFTAVVFVSVIGARRAPSLLAGPHLPRAQWRQRPQATLFSVCLLCCSLPWCWLAGVGCGGAVRVQRDPPRFHHIDAARNACRPALRKAQCRRRSQSLAQSQRSSAPSVLPPPASSHACALAARLTRSPTSCDVRSGFIWSHGGAMLTPYRTFYRRSAGRAASLLPLRLRWLYDLIAFVLTSAIFREPLTSHE
jgi:hypothetical protein